MRTSVSFASAMWAVVACGGAQPIQRASAPEPSAPIQLSSGAEHASAPAAQHAQPVQESPIATPNRAAPHEQSAKRADSAEPVPQEFQVLDGKGTAKAAHGVKPSHIKGTETEAALKFIVVDKDKGPMAGIVIALTAPGADKLYAMETDAEGYTEVLVPNGRTYEVTYLSLGRRDVAARVTVSDEPKQNIKLTMRYKRIDPPARNPNEEPRFVLDGVNFDTGSAKVKAESFGRLDGVVEYMTHKPSSRIEITGHTDNAGSAKANKALSQKRADACRDYLAGKGIDPRRIVAIGYGDERPIAPNDTPAGRERNRRIEATELRD